MIKRETIDKIIDATRIEEVVADFVNLRKRGSNWVGLCPFHNEKTPSFSVSPSKGIFKCFGCGEAGDGTRFVMKHEKYTYPEALRYLAAKYNIEIEEEEMTPEMEEERSERESLMNLLAFASAWFHKQLTESDKGVAVGMTYFQDREFSPTTIETFELGYAHADRDVFLKAAKEAGYEQEQLVAAGLLIKTDDSLYDRFRGRVIFPIHNVSGRVIAFGGRILGAADRTAKYINSPETLVYEKSRVLYGLHLAKNRIAKEDVCYLVEGYTDVISLYQAGIQNVVSSSGTSLTTDQIRQIRRYTQNVTILYDGDEAGVKASLRGMDMLLSEGMNVRVVLFPEGEDPDSYARKHRRNEVEAFLKDGARDFITFVTELKMADAGTDPVKRSKLVREIMESVVLIPDGITRQFYARECARLLEVEENVLFNEMNKLLRKKLISKNRRIESSVPDVDLVVTPQEKLPEISTNIIREKELTRLLLNYGTREILMPAATGEEGEEAQHGTVAEFIVAEVLHDNLEFKDPVLKSIFDSFRKAVEEGAELPTHNSLRKEADTPTTIMIIDLITERDAISENWGKNRIEVVHEADQDQLFKTVESAVLRFKHYHVEQYIQDIDEKLEKDDGSQEAELVQHKMKLNRLRQDICRRLGIVITR